MNIFQINTTAYEEEDFFLLTDLKEEDIIEVIMPIVNQERDGYEEYDNYTLVESIQKRFPKAYVSMFSEFDRISV